MEQMYLPEARRPIGLVRTAWKGGGWRERMFVAYLSAYYVMGFVGFALLAMTHSPPEVIWSYSFAVTFGMAGLWPFWFSVFVTSVPVLKLVLQGLSTDDLRRPNLAAHLSYIERYGVGGGIP